jgi:hypothetical protein
MDFESIYRQAMKDRAPALYRDLSSKGRLGAHIQDRARTARERLRGLIQANGFEDDMNGQAMLEETVLHELLDPITTDKDKPTKGALAQFEAFVGGARIVDVTDDQEDFDEQDDEFEEEDDAYDLDDDAAASILAEFELHNPAADACEPEQVVEDETRGLLAAADDLDEAEASAFLNHLCLRAVGQPSLETFKVPPFAARGPRTEFQYRCIRCRWSRDSALLLELRRTGLLAAYLQAITAQAYELRDDILSNPELIPYGVDNATEWAMNHFLDFRSDEEMEFDRANMRTAEHWALAEGWAGESGLWGYVKAVALIVGVTVPGIVFLVIMHEGLLALGWWPRGDSWWEQWEELAPLIALLIAGVVGWTVFARWRERFRMETVRVALGSKEDDSATALPHGH